MDTVRREERNDVVDSNVADNGAVYSGPRVVDVNPNRLARTTAHQTETFTGDPYPVQSEATLRVQGASICC